MKRRGMTSVGMRGSLSYAPRQKKSRNDWAGIGPGDGFRHNLDAYIRLPAQKIFYGLCGKAQRAAAQLAGADTTDFKAQVKPQLAPCYTDYPATPAALAAVGLTAFLEFEKRVGTGLLTVALKDYLADPAEYDGLDVDRGMYKTLMQHVARSVQMRLLLDDLARYPSLASVEMYRLFAASHLPKTFRSGPEMVRAVVLFGDVLATWASGDHHPTTHLLLSELSLASAPYFDELANADGSSEYALAIGAYWVKDIGRLMARFLPPPRAVAKSDAGGRMPMASMGASPAVQTPFPFEAKIPPLNDPAPPSVLDPPSLSQQLADAIQNDPGGQHFKDQMPDPEAVKKSIQKMLESFEKAIADTAGQQADWEDMGLARVAHALSQKPFEVGPIEGSPTDGHDMAVKLGSDETAHGELYDRPAPLSDDLPAYEALMAEAQPIIDEMRRSLYPNIERVPTVERLCANGSLDGHRLVLADLSEAIYKRYRMQEEADPRGRPVLLIAADGSGSLSAAQMKIVKLLSAASLQSTIGSGVSVLSGLYHSGAVRQGLSGPLVQWILHETKTPAVTRQDAGRAIVSLPNSGTGVQSDALSLAFMLDEARQLSRGRMVYLILITDCAWNRSFSTPRSGFEEVFDMFKAQYEQFDGKLHTTLVALGKSDETGLEDLLNNVTLLSQEDLKDPVAVADKIGRYVASCLRERRRASRR